jgi:hypothetical protein
MTTLYKNHKTLSVMQGNTHNPSQPITNKLSSEQAVALLSKGKDAWNLWVKENPVADIYFKNLNFSTKRDSPLALNPDFSGLIFPKGIVSFDYTNFGDNSVSFKNTHFGDGPVYFSHTTFGKGSICFDYVRFGIGAVSFANASFNKGSISFDNADFGQGTVSFENAKFDAGEISFNHTNFGNGAVSFTSVIFGPGTTSFNYAFFGEGDISFKGSKFGEGSVYFTDSNFGSGSYNFEKVTFLGHVDFSNIRNISQVKSLSFKFSSFEKTFNLSGNKLKCIVDLTSTKTTHHTSLDGFEYRLIFNQLHQRRFSFKKAKDPNDIARLRRLKELAEHNSDHERVLQFHADEMRAKRWHENNTLGGLLFDYSYDILSDYGRSELRPSICLLMLWLLFGCLYYSVSGNILISTGKKWAEALAFSGSQIFPIIPGSRVARTEGIEILFFNNLSPLLHLATFIQSVLSLMFLFLIGLALRNRFRI